MPRVFVAYSSDRP